MPFISGARALRATAWAAGLLCATAWATPGEPPRPAQHHHHHHHHHPHGAKPPTGPAAAAPTVSPAALPRPGDALLAADPATPDAWQPSALPAAVRAEAPAVPADLAEARAIWRAANERVARFPRGHIDLLKAEPPEPAASADRTAPRGTLSAADALRASLRTRPDLLLRPGLGAADRAAVQAAWAAHRRAVASAWVEAVSAQARARLADASLDAQRTGAELGRRMVLAGNWSEAQHQREQLAEAGAWTAAAAARRAADLAVADLGARLGLWEPADLQALAAQLPTELPALPPRATAADDSARALADAVAADPHLALKRQALAQERRGLPPARLAAWRTAHDAAIDASIDAARDPAQATPRPPAIDDTTLLNDRALQHTLAAEVELRDEALNRRRVAREAWAELHDAHATARLHDEVITRLQTRLEQETLLRYNGMLQSTWDLLASARERLAALDAAVAARARYWRAEARWQALLAGASDIPSVSSTPSLGSPAAAGGAPH